MRVRSHLVGLVLAAVLPVLVLVGVLVALLAHQQREALELSLRSTTRALAAAVDERIASASAGLQLLAASEDFDAATLAAAYGRASRAVRTQEGWASVALVRPDGVQLFHTAQPFGAPLPAAGDQAHVREVLATGKPVVSGYRVSRASGVPGVAVAVPVRRDGRVAFVLVGTLAADALSRLLEAQALPAGWTAGVLDAQGTIVARSRAPERFVGQPATQVLAARARAAPEAVFEDVTQEGDRAYGAFTRSRDTGWTVVLGLPASAAQAPFRRTLWVALGGGALLLALGVALALVLGRRLARPILALSAAADALGRGEAPPGLGGHAVTEVGQVARALEEAGRARGRGEALLREQSETLETLNALGPLIAAELDLEKLVQAVTDAATRLTGAQFGAFFYNVINAAGESFMLYTISGVPREAFSRFPMPRNTAVFHPTFVGEGVVRSDDITKDPRYGKSAPHHGMPRGHLPVTSYLAVPVVSRSGEVIGGLFFGHEQAGVFTERAEQLAVGLASQAAVAMDNARLFQRAQEAVRLRDDFLSVASHELRTPLTPLQLQLQLLLRTLRTDPARARPEAVERVLGHLGRLARLVDELLDVSRLSSGRLELHPEPAELGALLRDVAGHLESERERSGSALVLEDGGAGPVVGEWDRARLEQVFTNLLSNAIKYGEGRPIRLALTARDGWATVEVEDRGIGISAEDQARIFERFERAVSSRHYAGLGLGLWIVRRLLDALGGEVAVRSAPGQGTCFTVRLPLQAERRAAAG